MINLADVVLSFVAVWGVFASVINEMTIAELKEEVKELKKGGK